jgi:hypothetical protein
MLHWHLLDSQGWHQLSPHARLAYLELARLYNGENNGRISLSARRLACQMPCDKATASRALRELEDAGFIETMRVGTFTRKDRLASEYRLCIYTCDVTGDLPNRQWNGLRWSPSDGTAKSYRTGAQTRYKEAENPSTVRANRTVSPEIDASTVRANRTHLESAMGRRPKGRAYRAIPSTPDGEMENQVAAFLPSPSETKDTAHEDLVNTKSLQFESEQEGFPELPDFLRRVRIQNIDERN